MNRPAVSWLGGISFLFCAVAFDAGLVALWTERSDLYGPFGWCLALQLFFLSILFWLLRASVRSPPSRRATLLLAGYGALLLISCLFYRPERGTHQFVSAWFRAGLVFLAVAVPCLALAAFRAPRVRRVRSIDLPA